MELKLDMESIELMNIFENFTGVKAKDCIVNGGVVYFLTVEDQAQMAIGKNGRTVRNLENKIKKRIKIFEYSSDIQTFINNLIPKAGEIKISDIESGLVVNVRVGRSDKSLIIGRDGKNLKMLKEILQRNSNVKELNIR